MYKDGLFDFFVPEVREIGLLEYHQLGSDER